MPRPCLLVAYLMMPMHLYVLILVAGAILAGAYFLLRRKPKTADDLERERREWLDKVGRITDGTVIDVQEMPGSNDPVLDLPDLPVRRCRSLV